MKIMYTKKFSTLIIFFSPNYQIRVTSRSVITLNEPYFYSAELPIFMLLIIIAFIILKAVKTNESKLFELRTMNHAMPFFLFFVDSTCEQVWGALPRSRILAAHLHEIKNYHMSQESSSPSEFKSTKCFDFA